MSYQGYVRRSKPNMIITLLQASETMTCHDSMLQQNTPDIYDIITGLSVTFAVA